MKLFTGRRTQKEEFHFEHRGPIVSSTYRSGTQERNLAGDRNLEAIIRNKVIVTSRGDEIEQEEGVVQVVLVLGCALEPPGGTS